MSLVTRMLKSIAYAPAKLVLGVVLALALLYWPVLGYVGYRLGVTGDARVGTVAVTLADGWFPILSSEGEIARFLGLHDDPPGVLYVAMHGGIRPWVSHWVAIRDLDVSGTELLSERQPRCGSRLLSWGEVSALCTQKMGEHIFVSTALRVAVYGDEDTALYALRLVARDLSTRK